MDSITFNYTFSIDNSIYSVNLNCNYPLAFDLAPNGISFGAELIGNL